MTRFLVYAAAIIGLLSFNLVFPAWRSGMPNFLFLFVVFLAFQKDNEDFLFVAFASGLMLDIFSHSFFGSYTISFLLLSFGIHYLTNTLFSSDPSPLYMILVIGVSYLILIGMLYIIDAIWVNFHNTSSLSPYYLYNKVWIDLLFNLIFAAPVYMLAGYCRKLILKGDEQKTAI